MIIVWLFFFWWGAFNLSVPRGHFLICKSLQFSFKADGFVETTTFVDQNVSEIQKRACVSAGT